MPAKRRKILKGTDLKCYYSDELIAELRARFDKINNGANNLLLAYTYHPFKSERAREYANNGFARRVSTLSRCIHNIFEVVPPSTVDVPSREHLYDAQINLQTFMANVYGCIDNLAWIWVYEKGLHESVSRNRVGFKKTHKEVRSSLSQGLQEYLDGIEAWMDYVIDFRDALAHRIPLYIPPGTVPKEAVAEYNDLMRRMNEALSRLQPHQYDELSAQLAKLLVFQPMMTHSITEAKGLIRFHAQVLADFATVEELGQKMMSELKRL
jgi:hypothetical protein